MEYLVINIEENRLISARFRLSRRSSELLGAASFELGTASSVSDALRGIAEGLTGNPRVILCLQPSLFARRSISLPLRDLRKVREVLPSQMSGELSFPVEELVLDVIPAGNDRFTVLWAKKADIRHALELFREAGIEPQVVSSVPFASSFLPGLPTDCALFDGSALTIISGGQMSFFRALEPSGAVAGIGTALAALELTGVAIPPRLVLTGAGGGSFPGLETLPLPAVELEIPPDMGGLFKNDATFRQLAGLYSVARSNQAGELPDFRRGELAWTAGDAESRKKFITTAVLAAILLVLLFSYKLMQYQAAKADIESVNSSVSAIYREIFPNRAKAVDEISEVRGEIKKLSSGREVSEGYLDILKKLAEAKGTTINGLYEAEMEGRTLRVKGDARSAQAVNEFRSAIAPLMSTTELGEIKSRPDGTVSFTLTGTLKGGVR